MKILLIGRNGQIGTEVDKLARLKKYEIKSPSHEELDITQPSKLKIALDDFRPEIIINTAAYHVVSECEQYPQKAFEVNAIAVRNLATLCNEKKIKLVHFSTSWVFDGYQQQPYSENDICNPVQTYGLSKLAGEIFSLNYNPHTTIIRTCGVFGGTRGSRSKKGNFILNILKEARTKRNLEISSEQTTNITNAQDVALGTLQLLEKKAKNGIYHLTNSGNCSWADIAKKIVELKKLKLKIIPVDRKGEFKEVKIPLNSSLKNEKAEKLGIILPSWENSLKRYLKLL
ncbi:MAG: dTDP-4-dehydrorhamnose reductase [Candidatus Levybacteria bacterium]|nr:dTDP-4-dehydrorhamnose reductase [Candidatus Levybacteria bacterium]